MPISVGLDDYLVHGIHGFYDKEHTKPQPFNISIRVDLSNTVEDGQLGSTVDYAQLQEAIDNVVLHSSPSRLLETMAQRISEQIQHSENVVTVFVRIEKPEAPLPHPGGLPYIEYTWNR
ncbi:MAG: dihydroneopterin aldolase, partial [Candidatus Poseidoniaceae archaeon]